MKNTLLAGAALLVIGWAGTAQAGKQDILIGLDSKIIYGPQGQANVQPGRDQVLVMDVSNPGQPRIRASLDLPNSLLGPPTNLGITPDGKLGLVANSVVHTQDGNGWKVQPDDKLFVIDLDANPPKLAGTVSVGKQPSGLAIARSGNLALVANRAGKSVSVLSIGDAGVKHLGDVDVGEQAAAVAIAPDGKRAFVALNLANKIGVLEIDGQTVKYDKAKDIPAAFNPYNVAVTPDGRYAIASATGGGGANADALTVIEITGPHPHVVDITSVGAGPEGMAISPDGQWLVTPLLLGTSAKHSDWFYTPNGEAVLAALGKDGSIAVKDRQKLGGLPEGVAFSGDGHWVYIGNYSSKDLQVFRIVNGKLEPQGQPLQLPGQPASMRGINP